MVWCDVEWCAVVKCGVIWCGVLGWSVASGVMVWGVERSHGAYCRVQGWGMVALWVVMSAVRSCKGMLR